jgi:hypothetical protein
MFRWRMLVWTSHQWSPEDDDPFRRNICTDLFIKINTYLSMVHWLVYVSPWIILVNSPTLLFLLQRGTLEQRETSLMSNLSSSRKEWEKHARQKERERERERLV